MIELHSVTKLYGTVIGVNDMTLSLAPGAHGLLGPNGAGKTTFLNLITGQLRPTLGRVRVFGRNPRNNRALLQQLGVCPGDEALYSNVSGFEWVRYQLELHGFRRAEAGSRSIAGLTKVGMADALDRNIGTYSRGMRQRTKLAQAIAHEPDLLVLDEPFNGLDPVGRHVVTELLRDWIQQGRSLMLASHILHEVEAISSSFLLINGGRLLASGNAAEVNNLLADVPNQITIRCDQPRKMGRRLLAEQMVHAVEVNGGDSLVVSTRSPLALYERLPSWTQQGDFQIHELRSSDESLQTLFDSLMKVHRGGE